MGYIPSIIRLLLGVAGLVSSRYPGSLTNPKKFVQMVELYLAAAAVALLGLTFLLTATLMVLLPNVTVPNILFAVGAFLTGAAGLLYAYLNTDEYEQEPAPHNHEPTEHPLIRAFQRGWMHH